MKIITMSEERFIINCSKEEYALLMEARNAYEELKKKVVELERALQDGLDVLSDDERKELLSRYCFHCGCIQEDGWSCQCWDNE